LSDGEFKINLIYSDSINVRRKVEETIVFDSSYFTERISAQKTTGIGSYILYVLVILVVIYFIYRKIKKIRAKKNKK
jgi:flagellar biosynthesis/type III secretory pathway M-ring protein FliF/YscJ